MGTPHSPVRGPVRPGPPRRPQSYRLGIGSEGADVMQGLDKTLSQKESLEFLEWLSAWHAALPALSLEDAIGDPRRTALFGVDLINGFAYEGNLASPRVAAIVPLAAGLFRRAYERGLRNYVLIQEAHSPQAKEFEAFGRHGEAGTHESETVPELARLPMASGYVIAYKNSIHTLVGTQAGAWVEHHPEVDTYIVAGDCTDLCAYDLAMDLKLRANAADVARRVIIPANLVDTYDLPLAAAQRTGALPHPGEFMHRLFLYHLALNGIEIVREIN